MLNDKKIKALVVEDDYFVCEEIKSILYKIGCEIVAEASNGEDAVSMVCEINPDVVIMDIQMPKMNGIEATRLIQEKCSTPVIIMTAYETDEILSEASEAGVSAYLTKPPRASDLERAIIVAMARHYDLLKIINLNEELKAALKEIKTLQGMLPICARCKKVRDDSGFWHKIEKYIEERSDAKFTHGVCPDCEKELYGHEEWYQKAKKKHDS